MIGLIDSTTSGLGGRCLILASGSPRRRDLLKSAGLTFKILSPDVEELEPGAQPPRELCLTNARLKACAVAQDHPHDLVLGSDTVVALDGQVYGKPSDLSEAADNLRRFSGRVHEVMTGVALMEGEVTREFVEVSYVKFRPLTEDVISEYLSLVPVLDKAGGYAIQDHGEMIIEKIEGDYDNIVGLPVTRVLENLRAMKYPT